ncbi:uncharacterized protein [Coffea arabica]|uniref:Uncharacterized protein n=1 Tax=Coffea arabica TaxID=13443 RepID=A0A6P6T0I8_COFAR
MAASTCSFHAISERDLLSGVCSKKFSTGGNRCYGSTSYKSLGVFFRRSIGAQAEQGRRGSNGDWKSEQLFGDIRRCCCFLQTRLGVLYQLMKVKSWQLSVCFK